MKKLLAIISMLFMSFAMQAQYNNHAPSENVKKDIEILKKADLGLTDMQITRLTTVLTGIESNETKLTKSLEGNKSQLELHMKDFHANKINNIKGTMDKAQAEKFDALKLSDKL